MTPCRRRGHDGNVASIELRTLISAPPQVCFDLSRDLDLHLESMASSSERAVGGRTSGLIDAEETVTWEGRHFGRTWRMTSRISEFDPPRWFVDEMVSGPFGRYRHEHEFVATETGTLMIDRVNFSAPLGPLGRVAEVLFLHSYLTRLLTTRNNLIKERGKRHAHVDEGPDGYPDGT